jgi:hypothetical protein
VRLGPVLPLGSGSRWPTGVGAGRSYHSAYRVGGDLGAKAKPSQFVRIGRLKESRWQSKVRGWVGEEKKKKTRIQRRPARGGLVFFVPWVGRRGKERRHCTLSAVAAEQEGKVGEGNLQTCLLSRLCWRASHLNLLRSCMCMI